MSKWHQEDALLDVLLANLDPAKRRKMLCEVAWYMRRIQQQNMIAQRGPDDTA